jgi:hypothetical protein
MVWLMEKRKKKKILYPLGYLNEKIQRKEKGSECCTCRICC